MNGLEKGALAAIVALLWIILGCLASIAIGRWKANRRLRALMAEKYPTHAQRLSEEQ